MEEFVDAREGRDYHHLSINTHKAYPKALLPEVSIKDIIPRAFWMFWMDGGGLMIIIAHKTDRLSAKSSAHGQVSNGCNVC